MRSKRANRGTLKMLDETATVRIAKRKLAKAYARIGNTYYLVDTHGEVPFIGWAVRAQWWELRENFLPAQLDAWTKPVMKLSIAGEGGDAYFGSGGPYKGQIVRFPNPFPVPTLEQYRAFTIRKVVREYMNDTVWRTVLFCTFGEEVSGVITPPVDPPDTRTRNYEGWLPISKRLGANYSSGYPKSALPDMAVGDWFVVGAEYTGVAGLDPYPAASAITTLAAPSGANTWLPITPAIYAGSTTISGWYYLNAGPVIMSSSDATIELSAPPNSIDPATGGQVYCKIRPADSSSGGTYILRLAHIVTVPTTASAPYIVDYYQVGVTMDDDQALTWGGN